MQPLDIDVIESALHWLGAEQDIWLCTVVSTFGSSPRAPGSLFAVNQTGNFVGSLSGGCVEEDFVARLLRGEITSPMQLMSYGGADNVRSGVTLPCDGVLEILVEHIKPTESNLEHLQGVKSALLGRSTQMRQVDLAKKQVSWVADNSLGERVDFQREHKLLNIRVSPVARLIICGVSPVAIACADFASALGFEVKVCDPRPEVEFLPVNEHIEFKPLMPSLYIAEPGNCHNTTAVVALTHDPRIDDLAMIEAVTTAAFYIGVMGSRKTSAKRSERLQRSGGLTQSQIDKIHMPIGLAIGSKTPAEIALAVMADIVRVLRGRSRDAL